MTKAKMKEKAIDKIESRICHMNGAQDLPCLELYDAAISSQIRLVWQLEIISKAERDVLEIKAMEKYFSKKRELEIGPAQEKTA